MKRWILLVALFLTTALAAEDHKDVFMRAYGCQLHDYFLTTEYASVADLILAKAAFESGWGRAGWVDKSNQVFAMHNHNPGDKDKKKKSKDIVKNYSSFEESLLAQYEYYVRRKYPTQRDKFIDALDRYCPKETCGVKDYPQKILSAEKTLKRAREKTCVFVPES